MGETFGRHSIDTAGRSIQVSADGRPEVKVGGLTVDWTTIAAIAGSDVTYLDGVTVKVGEKALRYGQVLTKITASAQFGPFDPSAVDGRQTLTRGDIYIVNETTREDEIESNHPPVLSGGTVFRDRIIQSGVGAASLAAGPTLATLLAAMPRLEIVTE